MDFEWDFFSKNSTNNKIKKSKKSKKMEKSKKSKKIRYHSCCCLGMKNWQKKPSLLWYLSHQITQMIDLENITLLVPPTFNLDRNSCSISQNCQNKKINQNVFFPSISPTFLLNHFNAFKSWQMNKKNTLMHHRVEKRLQLGQKLNQIFPNFPSRFLFNNFAHPRKLLSALFISLLHHNRYKPTLY